MTKKIYKKIALGASADGWHPSKEFLHLYEPAQKAVIYWNGNTEIMVLSSAVRSDVLTDIAWIVPIISTTKPNISAGNMSVFEQLVDFFGYSNWWNNPYIKMGGMHDGGRNVSVIEVCEVDIFDVIIIQATNTSDLIDWLLENDLMVPEEAHDVIDRYVQMDNCYFIINKLDLKNRFKDIIEQLERGEIPENMDEYNKALNDLKIGMATPLQFEFTPPEPYYPLVISSLNQGDGKIEVYVIEKPVADLNGIMQVDNCKKITEELKEKLLDFFPIDDEEYITKLSFNGLLEDLVDDAVFEFFMISSKYDPVFIYIPSNLDNLTGHCFIDVMAFDPNGGLFELQFRTDKTGPWMVAERTDVAYFYQKWWYNMKYNIPLFETDGATWTIELDASNLTDGNHTIEFRVLRKINDNMYYTPIYTQNFTIGDESNVDKPISSQSDGSEPALTLSSLIILSMVAVAFISKKTKITK